MIARKRAGVVGSTVAALCLAACAPKIPPAGTADPAAGTAAALQLASFDQAWTRIGETFPYADMRGLDWQAVRDELRPTAARARSADDVRPIIGAMIARLGESHFQVIAGASAAGNAPRAAPSVEIADEASSPPGDLGFEIRPIGDEIVVTHVDADSPAALSGVARGWSLLAVDGLDTRKLLSALRRDAKDPRDADVRAWTEITSALHGGPGTTARLSFRERFGKTTLHLVRRRSPGETMKLGNLPPIVARLESEVLPGDVGVIRFNIFLVPIAAPFTDAVKGFIARDVRGIVIDVRGNPGGIGGMVMGLAGHFVSKAGSLGTMTTREGRLEFTANPRGRSQVFEGPLAVLVDGMSVSTSELFAAGLQHEGRARLFGQRTAGMALPSIIETLPNGDRLQFAVADLHDPSGRRIEGAGVEPDVEIVPTRERLLAGGDPALDAALEWIRSQGGPPRG